MGHRNSSLLLTAVAGPFGFLRALGWRHFYGALACYIPAVAVVTVLIAPLFGRMHAALQLLVSFLLAFPAVSLPLCLCLVRAERVLRLLQSLPHGAGGKALHPLRHGARFSLVETGCILFAWCQLLALAGIPGSELLQQIGGDAPAYSLAITLGLLLLDGAVYFVALLLFRRRTGLLPFGSMSLPEHQPGPSPAPPEPRWLAAVPLLSLVFGPFGYLYYGWGRFAAALAATAGCYATVLLPAAVWVQYVEIGKTTVEHPFGPYGEYGAPLLFFAFLAGVAVFAGAAFFAAILLTAYTARLNGIERRMRHCPGLPGVQGRRAKGLAGAIVFAELLLLGTLLPADLLLAAAMLLDTVAYFDGSMIWLVAAPLAVMATVATALAWVALSLCAGRAAGLSFFPFQAKTKQMGVQP